MATPIKSARVSQTSAISFDPATTLTVRVGPPATYKTFLVHEFFLTARSEYFRRAMNGKWAESETRTIDLTEDDPEIFALYLNPVYNNHLPTMAQDLEHMRSLDRTAFITAFVKESNTIFRLYVLAEKLQDPSAQDAALAAILDLSDLKQGDTFWLPPPACAIRKVYANTPQDSPARRLIVDMWSNLPGDWLRKLHGVKPEVPREFLCDLMIAIRDEAPVNIPNRAKSKGILAYLQKQKVSIDPQGSSEQMSTPV